MHLANRVYDSSGVNGQVYPGKGDPLSDGRIIKLLPRTIGLYLQLMERYLYRKNGLKLGPSVRRNGLRVKGAVQPR